MKRLIFKRNYYHSRLFQMKHYKTREIVNSNSKEVLSSNIRQKFLDYFIKANNHNFIRSSPVMPFCDPTVAFVNAGMNQFKSIFLGQQEPLYKRVANTQKCIRVGGKHNDLNVVGTDGFHHTFFEMLGNWSFGDYFKKEACELSWNLLLGPYCLNPSTLYVTYFGGDKTLNLEPDFECREIWRLLGISDDHILPFGVTENFWEMGLIGPCGPCTEILIDHTRNNSRQINTTKKISELTELWNIVFIQYNRNIDGNIEILPKHHIDTGMGLERLTAILQGRSSNYETDIFHNIFKRIQKVRNVVTQIRIAPTIQFITKWNICKGLPEYQDKYGKDDKNGINTTYRIIADHSRMVTACLADGIIPEQNQKLRRILRKVLFLSETVLKQEKCLLNELTEVISYNFRDIFPEMEKNLNQIQQIIEFEEEIYKSIRTTAIKDWQKIVKKQPALNNLNILEMPGLIAAYNELISSNYQSVNYDLAFKMYDTYGLDEHTMKLLFNAMNIQFNSNDIKTQLILARNRKKPNHFTSNNLYNLSKILEENKISKTDDSFKYSYYLRNGYYVFNNVEAKLLCIIKDNEIVDTVEPTTECYLVLNRTNLYSESGGQVSDKGFIDFSEGNKFNILDTHCVNGYVFHKGIYISQDKLKIGQIGTVNINEENRLKCMSNHTTTHLLNTILKQISNGASAQKSSKVFPEWLTFDVGIYSKKLTVDDIKKIEDQLRDIIKKSTAVKIREINSQEFLSLNNVTLVPGEVYPDVGIRLVEICENGFLSREPCCGTHVLNTSDIEEICIINMKSLGRSTLSLSLVTKDRAKLALKNGQNILNEINNIQKNIENLNSSMDSVINEIRQKLNYSIEDEFILPVYVKAKCLKLLDDINKHIRNIERDSLKKFVDLEMSSVLQANLNKSQTDKPYIVHFLGCSSILDNVPLQRATKKCSNVPVIVISYSDEIVKARCCVPKSMITEKFNAELWMKNSVLKIFNSPCLIPKNEDSKVVCNMKAKRVNKFDWESILEKALLTAKNFANKNL